MGLHQFKPHSSPVMRTEWDRAPSCYLGQLAAKQRHVEQAVHLPLSCGRVTGTKTCHERAAEGWYTLRRFLLSEEISTQHRQIIYTLVCPGQLCSV